MDLGEIGWGGMDLIGLVQDWHQWWAPVNALISLWVPYDTRMFLSGCTSGGPSSSAQLHTVSYIYLGNNLWLLRVWYLILSLKCVHV
jgi:hypothetical protein